MKFVTAIKRLIGRGELVKPTGVILHATAGASGQSSVEYLFSTGFGYHYIIERNGDIIVGIPKEQIAWHAGKSKGWAGSNCNRYTIGVAFANRDNGEPITQAQLDAAESLLLELKRKVPSLKWVSTHKWISPGRKTDPVAFSPKAGSEFGGLTVWK